MEYCNNYDFINYLLNEKIYDLLKSIHQHYPNLFKKVNINKELKIIIDNINLFNLDSKRIIKKHVDKKNKLILAKRSNIIRNKLKTNCKLVDKNNKITKSKINEVNRCQGRVWGNIIIHNESIIYGNQCKNRKSKNSDYCFIHKNKLSHGNYFTKPNIMIKNHFEKNSKKIIIK